jgi:PAS domain S-box-containing protein
MPLILIIVTTLVAVSASFISLLSGWLTIFQNLFYIPIILACYYYTRRGFAFSVLLSCLYFLLMLFASQDPVVLGGALIRVAIFIIVAGVITYLSTGRIEAEVALRESEDRYRNLFESSRDAIMILEPPAWRFTSGNRSALQMFMAKDEEEFTSREPWTYSPEFQPDGRESGKKAREMIETAMYNGTHFFEWTHKRNNGEIFPATVLLSRVELAGKVFLQATVRDITDNKRTEEALKESEKRYRDFFTTSRDAIFITSPGGRWIDFNDAALDMFGYSSREELMALPVAALYQDPDDRRALTQRLETNDYVKEYPVRLKRKDGSVIHTLITSVALREEGRLIKAFIGSVRDITEQRKAEHQIRLNAIRNKVLLRLHGMGANASEQEILRFSMEGSLEITESRFAFCGLINEDETEMTIHAWSNDVMKECTITDQAIHFSVKDLGLLGECIRQRVPLIINDYTGQHPAKHGLPGGHVPIHRFMMVPLIDENRIVAVAAVANKDSQYTEDDTEALSRLYYRMWEIIARKRAEEALRQREDQFRVIFNNQQIGLLIIDPTTHLITDANDTALAMIQASLEDVVGRICHTFVCPAQQGMCPITDLGQAIDKSERIMLTKTGEKVPVLKSVKSITIKDEQYFIESFIDITERKKAEEALDQANKKLHLMSSITRHDILNQLTVLRGYLELSDDYLNDPRRLKEFIEKEKRAAATIESQIRFTRDYQDLGLQAPSWQSVGLNIEKAVSIIPMRTTRVEMTGTGFEIFADPLCEKVFYNLIDNAVRHGGDRMTTIRFSTCESDRGMTIVVEDNGNGISPEDRKRLFERGFGKNTGLGLFLSREILSITGITITETGTPGCGARFEIAIPKGAYRITPRK